MQRRSTTLASRDQPCPVIRPPRPERAGASGRAPGRRSTAYGARGMSEMSRPARESGPVAGAGGPRRPWERPALAAAAPARAYTDRSEGERKGDRETTGDPNMAVNSFMVPLGTQAPDSTCRPSTAAGSSAPISRDGRLVIFLSNHCPYVRRIEEGIGRFAADYRGPDRHRRDHERRRRQLPRRRRCPPAGSRPSAPASASRTWWTRPRRWRGPTARPARRLLPLRQPTTGSSTGGSSGRQRARATTVPGSPSASLRAAADAVLEGQAPSRIRSSGRASAAASTGSRGTSRPDVKPEIRNSYGCSPIWSPMRSSRT